MVSRNNWCAPGPGSKPSGSGVRQYDSMDNFAGCKSDADGATLMPLNRQRNLAELNGQTVTFLEFN